MGAYDVEDFDALKEIVNASTSLIFCPNVLTETSNLLRYVSDPMRTEVSDALAQIVAGANEVYVESVVATQHEKYAALGLTDAVLLVLAETGAVLLTIDAPLHVAALTANLTAINYNHERERRLGI